MDRRRFVQTAATLAALGVSSLAGWSAEPDTPGGDAPVPTPDQPVLPRWRGFNLLEMFSLGGSQTAPTAADRRFREDDFRWIADWGFNFVRLPLCYLLWVENGDPYRLREDMLANLDAAVELGRKYRVHVCLNLHRAPGYSVNAERAEPYSLWKDPAALAAFCFQWRTFAQRYRGVSSAELSFNLVNEPAAPSEQTMTRADHERVVRAAVAAIREADPARLIVADGVTWATVPCAELADLKIAQSCRAYAPMGVSHYQAPWAGGEKYPLPTWPMDFGGERWDRARLERFYQPWAELARSGVGVHCGEGGAWCKTPHAVLLAWLRDVLEILQGHGIGWALWNLRGTFGVVDSERADVQYEEFHGHQLDRKLLQLLQAH